MNVGKFNMSRLPQDYIDFIAKGIAINLKAEGVPIKDSYTEEDLMEIFCCKNLEELYKKIEEIEINSIKALGLPIKESYTLEEIETKLNLAPGMIDSMGNSFEGFPTINENSNKL
jgi:hypothetical protein